MESTLDRKGDRRAARPHDDAHEGHGRAARGEVLRLAPPGRLLPMSHAFRGIAASDVNGLIDTLAPDVVLYSAVTNAPFEGREVVATPTAARSSRSRSCGSPTSSRTATPTRSSGRAGSRAASRRRRPPSPDPGRQGPRDHGAGPPDVRRRDVPHRHRAALARRRRGGLVAKLLRVASAAAADARHARPGQPLDPELPLALVGRRGARLGKPGVTLGFREQALVRAVAAAAVVAACGCSGRCFDRARAVAHGRAARARARRAAPARRTAPADDRHGRVRRAAARVADGPGGRIDAERYRRSPGWRAAPPGTAAPRRCTTAPRWRSPRCSTTLPAPGDALRRLLASGQPVHPAGAVVRGERLRGGHRPLPDEPVRAGGGDHPRPPRARRIQRFRSFVSSVRRRPGRTLWFKHVLLPHVPWQFYPSAELPPPRAGADRRPEQPDRIRRAVAREGVLPAAPASGRAGRLLGELLGRLRRGPYEDALVVAWPTTASASTWTWTAARSRRATPRTWRRSRCS